MDASLLLPIQRYDEFSNLLDYHGWKGGDDIGWPYIGDHLAKHYQEAFKNIQYNLEELYAKAGNKPEGPTMADIVKSKQLRASLEGIGQELSVLGYKKEKIIAEEIGKQYQKGFFETGFEVFKHHGDKYTSTGSLFQLNEDKARRAILNPVDKMTVSERMEAQRVDVQRKTSSILAQGLIQGQGYKTIATKLRNILEGDYKKAKRVACTEGHRVQNQAKQDAIDRAVELGVMIEKVWISSMDGKVRDSHASMNGVKAKETGPVPPALESKRDQLEQERLAFEAEQKKIKEEAAAKAKAKAEAEAKAKAMAKIKEEAKQVDKASLQSGQLKLEGMKAKQFDENKLQAAQIKVKAIQAQRAKVVKEAKALDKAKIKGAEEKLAKLQKAKAEAKAKVAEEAKAIDKKKLDSATAKVEELQKAKAEAKAKVEAEAKAKEQAKKQPATAKPSKPEIKGLTLNDIPDNLQFTEEGLINYVRDVYPLGFDYDEKNYRWRHDTRQFLPVDQRPHKLWNPVLKPKTDWNHLLSPWARQAGLTNDHILDVNAAQSEAFMKPEVTIGVRRGMRGAMGFFKDLRMKTQFETNRSSGFIGKAGQRNLAREEAEMRMFGYDTKMPPEQRPVYGYVDRREDSERINRNVGQYGPVKFVMKQQTKGKTTVMASDSLFAKDFNHAPSAMNDFRVESIVGYDKWNKTAPKPDPYTGDVKDGRYQWDDELLSYYSRPLPQKTPISDEDKAKYGINPDPDKTVGQRKLITAQEIRENPFALIDNTPYYMEAQIHGGCSVDDVEEVIFFDQQETMNKDGETIAVTMEENDKNAKIIEKECKKAGIPFRRVTGHDKNGDPIYAS